MSKSRLIINDGFNPELAHGAEFQGLFQFPVIKAPDRAIVYPEILVPFSQREKVCVPANAFVHFYEHDDEFADLIKNPDTYIDDLSRFAGIISPDNSLYRDIPLACQIANIYRNRLIGSYLQRRGLTVVPNIRWGDKRTYSTSLFDEAVAFSSAPKHNIVAIGCYGCIKSEEDRMFFEDGFLSMLDTLYPKAAFVYGRLPKDIIEHICGRTELILYNDWTSIKHGKEPIYGIR